MGVWSNNILFIKEKLADNYVISKLIWLSLIDRDIRKLMSQSCLGHWLLQEKVTFSSTIKLLTSKATSMAIKGHFKALCALLIKDCRSQTHLFCSQHFKSHFLPCSLEVIMKIPVSAKMLTPHVEHYLQNTTEVCDPEQWWSPGAQTPCTRHLPALCWSSKLYQQLSKTKIIKSVFSFN